jgi:hypothetical protein
MARARDLPDIPAPADTARLVVDPAGVGGTGSITIANLRNAGSSPVYFATLENDSGLSNQTADLQAQIDACETAGICEMILPPYLIWAEGLVISHPLLLRGTGIKVAMNALADGLPSDVGTRLIAKTGASPCIEVVTGANGATITGIQFLQDQPADGGGWAPDIFAPAILNWSAWTTIEKNSFWGCYDGVRLGKTWAEGGSAYVTIKNNTFACFHRGIHVYKAGDWNLIDGNWFQNYFVEDLTNQRAYIQANAEAMFIERADALAITNNGVFGHLYGIRTGINADAPTEAEGIAERLKLSNNDFDKVRIGVLLVKGCTGSATNTAIAGDNVVGSFAIQGGENVNFEFTNTRTINHGVSAIYAATTGCLMSFTNLTITTCNVDGGNPAMSAVAGATIIRSGKFSQTGASVIAGGAGLYLQHQISSSGTGAYSFHLLNTENLTANRALTVTLNDAARTINMGGNLILAGQFSTFGANALEFITTGTTSLTVPAGTGDTLATRGGTETFTGVKTFGSAGNIGRMLIAGNTSGTLQINAAAVAGTSVITLPAGTTNFSATGGTSQVVQQASAGAAFTVGQLAASNLSNGTSGSGAVVLVTSPTLVTPVLGAATATTINGAAIDNTAWSSSSLVLTTHINSSGGTITAASGTLRSKTIGKTYHFEITILVTTNGTGSGQINVTMPVTSTANNAMVGLNMTTNALLIGRINASGTVIGVIKYDGTYPVVSGDTFTITGVIEIN